MEDFNRTPALGGILKAISPAIIKRHLRTRHQQYTFNRAMVAFRRNPSEAVNPSSSLVADLIYGWANEGWSAFPEYVSACVEHGLITPGAILECGSGLTTVLLGAILQPRGNVLWALENSREWGQKVKGVLNRYSLDCAHISVAPLRNFGEFSWYDPPLQSMPDFSLVICDGPPSNTRGGRYGLMPVMKNKLKPGAVVLLDDAAREQERLIARQWATEYQMSFELVGSDRPLVRLTFQSLS